MVVRQVVIPGSYHDSVTLMQASQAAAGREGIRQAVAVMATPANLEIVTRAGLPVANPERLAPSDLLILVEAEDEGIADAAVQVICQRLKGRAETGAPARGGGAPRTLEGALATLPDANLALISVPGPYAAREAWKALHQGLHVMLFSDNVDLEDEVRLKALARQRGLLLMGPDCGTAILNGVPLGFANAVRRGSVGIVGASGTGIQEVAVLVHRLGGGISQAIGTGGRDLSEAVGGSTMLQGIAALEQDGGTEVIVLVSKPPAPGTARRVLEAVQRCRKPVVVTFMGGDPALVRAAGGHAAPTLEEAARLAVALARGGAPPAAAEVEDVAIAEAGRLAAGQRYVRGLFSGGTLCDEAILVCQAEGLRVYANVGVPPPFQLEDPWLSREHTMVDLGDDVFTRGRPHPMIDTRLRQERILREAADPGVAVILLDVVLGYGAHPDPGVALAETVARAKKEAAAAGRYLSVVASVCGTEDDPQRRDRQVEALRQAGALVAESNARAARLAARIVRLAGEMG